GRSCRPRRVPEGLGHYCEDERDGDGAQRNVPRPTSKTSVFHDATPAKWEGSGVLSQSPRGLKTWKIGQTARRRPFAIAFSPCCRLETCPSRSTLKQARASG